MGARLGVETEANAQLGLNVPDLGNRYRYWGSYAKEIDAIKEANGRNYRGVGYLDGKEKFFAYRVDLTPEERKVLRTLSEGEPEHMVLRFSPDPRD